MNAIVRRQTLSDIVRRSACRHPDKLAIVRGETRWSFAEFDAVVSRTRFSMARCQAGQIVSLVR
jgi:fatty-acyl-CoA synthase